MADDVNEWTELLVNSQYVPRVRHYKEEHCPICNCSKGEYHDLMAGCEDCYVCKLPLFSCQCEALIQPEIVCEV